MNETVKFQIIRLTQLTFIKLPNTMKAQGWNFPKYAEIAADPECANTSVPCSKVPTHPCTASFRKRHDQISLYNRCDCSSVRFLYARGKAFACTHPAHKRKRGGQKARQGFGYVIFCFSSVGSFVPKIFYFLILFGGRRFNDPHTVVIEVYGIYHLAINDIFPEITIPEITSFAMNSVSPFIPVYRLALSTKAAMFAVLLSCFSISRHSFSVSSVSRFCSSSQLADKVANRSSVSSPDTLHYTIILIHPFEQYVQLRNTFLRLI